MASKKNIIITGTSRGIGFEMVHFMAEKGHQVLALSRNALPVKNIGLDHVKAFAFDLGSTVDHEKVEKFISDDWKHVDILIHNAGSLICKPFSDTSLEDFKQVFTTNVFGVAELTRRVLPFMNKDGHVVNISSMGGVQGSMKFPGLAAYSSSKGALITLTELLAEEYKETGPSFNVLALGAVQTEMLEEAFPGYKAPVTAEEMARYIANFALSGQRLFNGKLLQVSSSTP
ncbi:MAG: SDR family oxidoreductase [Flavobacteriaceae bacterium]|nr:SDR family oxidoreductase [Bacteroidia bacterium]NNK87134.1 SDR family oxidoreductase [Flavobacteriaceae bacterium]